MAKRPTPAESSEKARLLVCAFAPVPGSSAAGVRGEQLLMGFSGGLDVDALTLKADHLTHIQRVGAARMLRVPVPTAPAGEVSFARAPFAERLGAFRRAVARQLDADAYAVVLCLDLFSAGAVAPLLGRSKLVVEVVDVPSLSFEKRWPVDVDDALSKSEWESAERAALAASTLVLVPSRQVARLLSDRTDARSLRVVPRLVDTRIFQPPTIELALDDVKTVAFLGGREGKSRSAVVAATIHALLVRVPDARVLVLGSASRADRQLSDDLTRRGVVEQVVLVDVESPQDLAQALCAAHVVVVAAGTGAVFAASGAGPSAGSLASGTGAAEGVAAPEVCALPHRALEAMGCGRPLVLIGQEAAYKDVLSPGVHARILSPDNAAAAAAAIAALLADEGARSALARAGLKQAQRFDLQTRLPELAQVLAEGTGVPFAALLPPLEERTSPAAIARAVPVTPLSETRAPSRPRITGPNVARVAVLSAPTSAEGGASGDVWAGDTLMDPHALLPSPSEPPPERVKAAMLVTQSGSRERPALADAAPATVESSGPSAIAPRSTVVQGHSAAPRSLQVAVDDDGGHDDWSRDTVADASPIEPTRPPATGEKPPQTHPPRSFLVQAGVGDMTAEDAEDDSSSSSD